MLLAIWWKTLKMTKELNSTTSIDENIGQRIKKNMFIIAVYCGVF